MYKINLKKFVDDLRGPRGLSALSAELQKVSREAQKLTSVIKPEAQARLKKVYDRVAELEHVILTTQKAVEKEVRSSLKVLEKQVKVARARVKKSIKSSQAHSAKAKTRSTKKVAARAKKTSSKMSA